MQIYCNPATYSTGDDSKPRLDTEPGFILSFQPCRPVSRGRIDIASADPDEEVLEHFRQTACTVYHPTSTCRMGTGETNSVLDRRFRVHGVKGLRVVDASAFSNITSGNTNAPTIMLARKGADLILEDVA